MTRYKHKVTLLTAVFIITLRVLDYHASNFFNASSHDQYEMIPAELIIIM